MIVLASLSDKAAWRGETYATTMRAIPGLPIIDCLRPTHDLVHGWKYWGETWEWYTQEYRKLMRLRWPDVKRWLESLDPATDITLVCFCPPQRKQRVGDGEPVLHCHRQLIAQMIAKWRPDIRVELR